MLRARIVTAVALLLVLLPALFAPQPEAFVILAWFFVMAGLWEWGRLNGLSQRSAWTVAALLGGVALGLWWMGLLRMPAWSWWIAGLAWVVGGVALLRVGVAGWGTLPVGLRLAGGYAALVLVWMALDILRREGHNLLLSSMALVWVADVFAYFGGKAWGRRKLAPNISPGKSWAGAYTGSAGVLAVGLVWIWMDQTMAWSVGSLFSRSWLAHGWGTLPLLLGLAAMSVVGDLVESLVKRAAGVKDSSQLLPGHGGVLDRVDALLPVLPLVVCVLGLT